MAETASHSAIERTSMTFLELLTLTAGVMGLYGAFMEGKKVGSFGILIGLIVGLCIGFAYFWLMRAALKHAVHYVELIGPKFQLILSWFFVFAAFVWIGISGVIASWVTRLVIHWVK